MGSERSKPAGLELLPSPPDLYRPLPTSRRHRQYLLRPHDPRVREPRLRERSAPHFLSATARRVSRHIRLALPAAPPPRRLPSGAPPPRREPGLPGTRG